MTKVIPIREIDDYRPIEPVIDQTSMMNFRTIMRKYEEIIDRDGEIRLVMAELIRRFEKFEYFRDWGIRIIKTHLYRWANELGYKVNEEMTWSERVIRKINGKKYEVIRISKS